MFDWQNIIVQIQNGNLSVSETNEQGETFLYLAVDEENFDVCKTLISLGANVNDIFNMISVLMSAVSRNNWKITKLLIDSGADVNLKAEDDTYSILHEALQANASLEIIKLLIDNNADVRAKTDEDYTILHTAAYNSNYKISELIINTKAILNIERSDNEGYTPFLKAMFWGNLKTGQLLVSKGADVSVICNHKERFNNALQIATRYWGTLETIQWLISIGFDANIKDYEGYSLLHYVAGCNRYSIHIAKSLIEKGLDVNLEYISTRESSKRYRTPLQIAMSNSNYKMADLLKKYGAIK